MREHFEKLREVALRQGGVFLASQAVDAGFLSTNHTYHERNRTWRRIARGIYVLAGFGGERENLIAIALWSRSRGAEGDAQVIFAGQTALGIAGIGLLNESSVLGFVPPGFRRRSEPPFPCSLARRELPETALLDEGVMLFEHPLHAALRMFEDETLSDDEARLLIEASLGKYPAAAYKAATWDFSCKTLATFHLEKRSA